jgi:hypothetical protein
MARRFVFNFFHICRRLGWYSCFFSPGILHELKNSYRHVFRFILRLRTKNLLQFPFTFLLLMCELLSLIISDAVRLNLNINILRTAAHKVGLGQILLDWIDLTQERESFGLWCNGNEFSNSIK